MKRSIPILVFSLLSTTLFVSCKKYLEKPDTSGTVTAETVFANRDGAEAAIANAYRSILSHGLWPDGGINNGTLPGVSGEVSFAESWMSLSKFINAGFAAVPNDGRPAQSTDNFFNNFREIRKCYIISENIDKVADLDANGKNVIKAEMKALVAYRYLGMFIRYGGVPLATKTLGASDDLNIPRASLQETLDFILKACDEAAAVLPNNWDAKYVGRMTRGTALAIKARTLLYAARPLFNSATPYLNGVNHNLICFGSAATERWTNAVAANEAVITWAQANGFDLINTGGSAGVPNANAFDDYATATSIPNNKEVLLAYKYDVQNDKFFRFYNAAFNPERYLIDNYGMLTNFLENYYKADGQDQTWTGTGVGNAKPFSEYLTKMNEMEPRFLADVMPHTINAKNNSGDNSWNYNAANPGVDRFGKGGNRGPSGRGRGAGVTTKFYYQAGSRNWFEFPLFRLAEFHLALAEAYNELGNATKALEHLNIVHNRAGLPSITETAQEPLRRAIQREWAVEFYFENKRYFDARHWKLSNIANGILGGPMRELQFTITGDALQASGYQNYYDNVVFTAYWDPKMFLHPIPQEEVDKGVIVQNPGY